MHQERKPNANHRMTDAEVVHSGDPVVLRNRHILTDNTVTSGQYEQAMKELLLELNLLVWYEGVTLGLNLPTASKEDNYPPDFITPLFVNGKQVIIELHNADKQYFSRVGKVRQLYGDRFYYILVKSNLDNPEAARMAVGKTNEHTEVDEFWQMPRITEFKRGVYSEYDKKVWKDLMYAWLKEFIEERADRVDNWEDAAALVNVRREEDPAVGKRANWKDIAVIFNSHR